MRRYAVSAVCLTFGVLATSPAAADCRDLDAMMSDFRQVYPTGTAAVFEGARGRAVMDRLPLLPQGEKVAFLYSGDGPVTGARGRYLFLVLDAADCIVAQDWIDGVAYDRVTGQQ